MGGSCEGDGDHERDTVVSSCMHLARIQQVRSELGLEGKLGSHQAVGMAGPSQWEKDIEADRMHEAGSLVEVES